MRDWNGLYEDLEYTVVLGWLSSFSRFDTLAITLPHRKRSRHSKASDALVVT